LRNHLGDAERRAFRALGLLAADFLASNLAALLGTDTDEAEWVGQAHAESLSDKPDS
jgi:hypothetical protein